MDETYSWHKGACGIKPIWPIPVSLQPDEIFSSWLVRAALDQGCEPLVLTGELWPKWRIWTRDPDRSINKERLNILSNASGIEASNFISSTLYPIISKLVSRSLDSYSLWPWVLALGTRNRRRSGGLQYCPICLLEDRKPYFRIQWRLSWHTHCLRHSILLCDRCSFCGSSVEPHRLLPIDKDLSYCATCKTDLRRNPVIKCNLQSVEFQKIADHVAIHGFGTYGNNIHSSSDWFELTRYFVNLLRRISIGKSSGLNIFTQEFGIEIKTIAPPATGLSFELLPVHERAVLLNAAWHFIQAGPNRFLNHAIKQSLSVSALCDRRKQFPALLSNMLKELPKIEITRKKKNTPSVRKPRSTLAVKRMWARLKRKYMNLADR